MPNASDLGKLLLRLTLGVMILLHGLHKLGDVGSTVQGMRGLLASHSLPVILAWGVFAGEVAGPILLIVGFYSRIGAILIFINMLFAIGLVHLDNLFARNGAGGWMIELDGMYLLVALAAALIGPGRYAINDR